MTWCNFNPFRAKYELDTHIAVVEDWEEFCVSLDNKMVCERIYSNDHIIIL